MPDALRAELIAHARAEAPQEACGLLAGTGAEVRRIIRCVNTSRTPVTRYAIDAREQLHAFRDLETNGEDLVAIYHSHPISQPYPSPTDRAEAHYPDAFYVLVSLRDAIPELRAYRIRDGWVREAAISSLP